ncbi:MAG: hypothetical protein ACYTBP_02720 [Planctomycetota bacterium]
MKRIVICITILLLTVIQTNGRERQIKSQDSYERSKNHVDKSGVRIVELTLYQSKAVKTTVKYQLLPDPNDLNDTDAVPLYLKKTLKKYEPIFKHIENAVKCKQTNWPPFVQNQMVPDLKEYRNIAYLLILKARLEMAQGNHNRAINTIRMGLTMARHMGQSSTLIQGLVGVAIGELTLQQIDELIQTPASPNLHGALKKLPEPLVDLTQAMDTEMDNLKNYNFLIRKQLEKQLKPAHDRIRLTMNKLSRHVTTLQCIEAIRIYAGSNQGKLPETLSEIKEVTAPDDPVTEKPFEYKRSGSEAVLKALAPESGRPEDAIHYKLTIKK